ncbi:MAG: transferase [Clostridia bacterium]
MKLSISEYELTDLLNRRLANYFVGEVTLSLVKEALGRTERCFSTSSNKYYITDHLEVGFSHLHSGQFCVFLYYLANTAWLSGFEHGVLDALYCLNKEMNAVDLYYGIELPEHWGAEHPLGSVMGRAQYGDYFFYQGCTVGGNKERYPTIGNCVRMYSNSKVLGDCSIGNHVIISANTYIKDEDVPDNSIVFGQSPNLVIKQKSREDIMSMNLDIWRLP